MKTTLIRRGDKPPITVLSHDGISAKIYSADRSKNGRTYEEHTLVFQEAGNRTRRVFADLPTAKLEAGRVLARIAAGQTKAASLTNAEAEEYALARQELARVGGVPVLAAVREYAAAVRQLRENGSIAEAVRFFLSNSTATVEPKAVSEIVAEMLRSKEQDGCSHAYLVDARLRLERFAKDFGSAEIASLTTKEIEDWLRGLGTGPRNRNNFARLITTLFKFARRKGYLVKDRATAADELERAKVKPSPVVIFTPEELTKILRRLELTQPNLLPFAVLGAFAGLRVAEIGRLDWQDVKFGEAHVVVAADKAKTAARRIVPILPNAAKWLAPFKGRTGPVCPFVRTAFMVAREAAKPITRDGKVEAGVKWKHNALRHSFVSYRLAAIHDVGKVALEAGNSPAMIFANYREIVTEKAAEAYWSIEPTGA